MKIMNLSAFVNLLYGYRKEKKFKGRIGHARFIKILVDALIPQDAIDSGRVQENLLETYYEDRMLQYIFNGEKPMGADVAAAIRVVMDDLTFEEYFEDFSETALEKLSRDLAEFGFEVHPYQVPKACSNIFIQLIEHIAEEQPEAVAQLDYVARGKGKLLKDIPPASIEYRDGHFHISDEVVTVDMSKYSDEEVDYTLRYVQALYEAYEDKLKRKITADNIGTMPQRLQENYREQNRAYYYADSVRHNIREAFDDDEEEFNKLKEDEFSFIRRTYWRPYDDAFERLEAVLDRATEANLSASVLAGMRNLINNLAKMGICQILVNEGVIKSWVIENE